MSYLYYNKWDCGKNLRDSSRGLLSFCKGNLTSKLNGLISRKICDLIAIRPGSSYWLSLSHSTLPTCDRDSNKPSTSWANSSTSSPSQPNQPSNGSRMCTCSLNHSLKHLLEHIFTDETVKDEAMDFLHNILKDENFVGEILQLLVSALKSEVFMGVNMI